MANYPYRDQPDVEQKFVTVELAERWLALASRAMLLLLTLGLGVTTIICALRGSTAAIPAGVGGASAAIGAATMFDRW